MAFLAMSFLRAEDADKKVKTDANIIGHVIEVSTGDHVPGVSIFLKGTPSVPFPTIRDISA